MSGQYEFADIKKQTGGNTYEAHQGGAVIAVNFTFVGRLHMKPFFPGRGCRFVLCNSIFFPVLSVNNVLSCLVTGYLIHGKKGTEKNIRKCLKSTCII